MSLLRNRYKIPEDKFTEITRMSEDEISRLADQSYINWLTEVDLKKKDPDIKMIKDKKKNLSKEIEKNPEVIELKAQLKQKVFELTSEEKARLDEELKNASSEYNRSIKDFRSMFYTCNDIKTKRVVQE
jgi:hypothetical protein